MNNINHIKVMEKIQKFRIHSILAIFIMLSTAVFGGVTGKITGTIVEEQSGDPMVGVNVIIKETTLGAATDLNGQFIILNITPATYDIQISMIGYADVKITNVRVVIDQTTDLGKIPISAQAIEMAEVVIEAKRKLVEKDVSGSYINIGSDDISALPVRDISQVIGLQAGIEGLNIRGSAQSQSAFMVDGFLLNDERSNNPYTSVSLNSVKAIQVQTGGFSAEYGNIRSGVINIITDDGHLSDYHGAVTIKHIPPTPKHFGVSLFDTSSFFLRPYLDNNVCWLGTESGAWDTYTKKQYPTFEGWNSISNTLMNDDNPDNDLTPQGAQRLFEFQHRRNGNITAPDRIYDFTIGGPVPIIGGTQFSLSHHSEDTKFIFPLSLDGYSDNSTRLKLTSRLSKQTKLNLQFLYGETHSVSPYQWKTTPTGSVLNSTYSVASLLNSSSGNSILFMPGYFSPTSIYRRMAGAKINHMFSSLNYIELIVQFMDNRYDTYQTADRDTSKTFEVVPGYFADEAPYGYWGYGETGIDGMSIGGWMNLGRDNTVNSTVLGRLDYVSQINPTNQIKTGISFVKNNYDVNSSTDNPSMSTWRRSMIYNVKPYRGALYIQDKLEYEGFIANAGIRAEISSANSDLYALDIYDDYYSQGLGNDIEAEAIREPSKPIITISPRLGISHPITVNSKLYFNYGHFFTEPGSAYRFRLQRESNGLVTHMGDPNMSLERTIAYEVGYSQSFLNSFLVNLTAYYKDVSDQSGWVYYQNFDNSVQYNKASNNNYEDIRGLEISLSKPTGKWFSGFVNYTYLVKTSGYFGLLRYYQDPNLQREYESNNIYQEKPSPRPYARSNLSFYTPSNFGPKVVNNFYPLADWTLSALASYKMGSHATYNPNALPGVLDNVQWKDRYYLDLKLEKAVNIYKSKVRIFVDINNVLNLKFLSYSGFSDYYDNIDYMESLHFDWEEGKENGNDRIGEFRAEDVEYQPYNPVDPDNPTAEEQKILDTKAYIDMPNFRSLTFLDPRKITIGIQVEF